MPFVQTGRLKFRVREGEPGKWDENIIREVAENDCYGLGELRFYHPNLGRIVDVGGHIGAFSALARSLWPKAGIVCAEPFGPNLELLRENMAGLGVQIVPKAVTWEEGEDTGFQWPSSHWEISDSRNTGNGKVNAQSPDRAPACRLGDLLGMLPGGDLDLLKIDIEGGEVEILGANKGLVPSIRFLRGEWHSKEAPEALRAMLEPTHSFESRPMYTNLGAFYASRKR
jgi:FkbM family methyltransferase